MLFALKKFIGSLLMPLPLILIVMAIALLLLWFTHHQKAGKIIFSLSWLFLGLLSLQPVADWLLRPLENTYPTYQSHSKVDYIVVLGGGYTFNPQWAPSSNLINNSLPRLAEGLRIYRQNPGAKIIFTGGKSAENSLSSAETSALVAESLGVPADDIITLDKPKDTRQEAQQVALRIGKQPFVLVTSASHLPRAMIFFEQQGLHPLPAPANQLAIDSPLNSWEKITPQSLYLSHSERAWYETLGRLWQWMLPAPKPEE
ncbi:envelope biogenesis factor ElyC [Rouxiella sp. Mn2063]|uniref:envelope biogenesis factor ElyC n=1 Tax=Rouxiella sp. Mn2063 TaxID=3395262 RepID=UPI003BDF2A8C